MLIENLYRPEVFSALASDELAIAAQRMQEAGVGALAVYDGAQLVGIISERDLARAVAAKADPSTTNVSEYMSSTLLVADINSDSSEVANRMLTMEIRHMPVLDGDRLVGMVSMRDLLAEQTWD